MGITETKQQALLLVGASGGLGTALLDFLSHQSSFVCIPTYNKNKPAVDDFSWVQYDSTNLESTRILFEELSDKYQIAVVIDVSGLFFASKLQKSSWEEIDKVISTNLVAPMVLAKNAQEFMPAGGKLILMSSIVSTMQIIGSSVYSSAKAGLERGILALSSEFSQTGHGICGIRLGYMNYGMTYKLNEKVRRKILESLDEEKFIDINVLGMKVLEICNSHSSDINGILYEIK